MKAQIITAILSTAVYISLWWGLCFAAFTDSKATGPLIFSVAIATCVILASLINWILDNWK